MMCIAQKAVSTELCTLTWKQQRTAVPVTVLAVKVLSPAEPLQLLAFHQE